MVLFYCYYGSLFIHSTISYYHLLSVRHRPRHGDCSEKEDLIPDLEKP